MSWVGSAPACHAGVQEFESPILLHALAGGSGLAASNRDDQSSILCEGTDEV